MMGCEAQSHAAGSPVLYVMPWLLLVTQCAARAPALTPAQLADAGRAEALMRDGCYTCLREAVGIYARLIEPAARKTPERVLRGAFDTTVLLAVREKELGLSRMRRSRGHASWARGCQ